MIKMNLFNREISNLDDLINVICENVLTSNYFIGDEHIVELDVNEIKSHLDEEELEDFEEFINRLFMSLYIVLNVYDTTLLTLKIVNVVEQYMKRNVV